MMQKLLKNNWIHLVALAAFLLVAVIYFLPSIQGKKLQAGDIMSWKGMAQESFEYRENSDEVNLWTNSMFGGMPTYYIAFERTPGPVEYIIKALRLGFKNEIGKFLLGMCSFYLLMIVLRVNPIIGIMASIAFAFSTNNIILLDAGHNTKVDTIMNSPIIISGVILAYRKKWLLGLVLFALGMSINMKTQHPQMTFYLGLTLIAYVGILFFEAIKKKTIRDFFISSGILTLGLVLALGTTANKTIPILEYSKDTMRGAPILKNSKSNDSSSKVDGLAWEYAMSWSNGTIDLLQSFISHSVGGGSAEEVQDGQEMYKELRKRGISPRNMSLPYYWGGLPSTSGPIYFGAVVFFLFILSLFNLNNNLKLWGLIAVVMTMCFSLGKNMEWFNRLFFDYFPYFNKFRTPNSVLSVTAVIIPIIGFIGLDKILSKETWSKKSLLYPGLGMILFTALIAILGPGIFDMSTASDINFEQAGINTDKLLEDRAGLLRSSGLKSACFMFLAFMSIFGFYKGWLKKWAAILIIGILAITDLVSVNLKYVNHSDFVSKEKYKAYFQPRSVDTQILQDKDLHYRVQDYSLNTYNSSFASYFHKTVGGYHAAKLQRFQDISDYHLRTNNMNVLNMLNTKYFITGERGNEQVRLNTAALGNAWFVNSVNLVNTADEEIEALSSFDPLGTAVVHKEFSNLLGSTSYDKGASTIQLTSYEPHRLKYTANVQGGDQLAIFSEVWYGPDKGWKATIDGQPADIFRANYILRGMKIPTGQHEIIMEFDPDSAKKGSIISWICSFILLGLILYYFFMSYKNRTWE